MNQDTQFSGDGKYAKVSSTIYKDGEPMNTPTTMNWIDESAEKLDRLDYEEEIAVRKKGVRTAVVVFEELRTALEEARTQGAQEALAKVEEWCKGKRRRSGCGCPPFQSSHDGPCWDEEFAGSAHAYNEALTDLLHHLQQLKDNKTV